MNTRRQMMRVTSLVLGSLAIAAGCSDSDEEVSEAEGGSGYGVGGVRAGGAKSTGGSRPMGGSGTTLLGTTSAPAGGTTATLTTGGAQTTVGGSAQQSAGGALGTGAGGTRVSVGGNSAGGSATTAAAGAAATTGGAATGGAATGGIAGALAAGAGGTTQTTTSAVAGNAGAAGGPSLRMSFFVTSDTNTTGDLGGISGADARCQTLANTVGLGSGVWRAYLSADARPSNGNVVVNARDRIGTGPWYNANDQLLANDLTELHSMQGDPDLFVDERGRRIAGQWAGSPLPIEHDILTGSTPTGTVMAGFNCEGWTSNSAGIAAQVGHSDGIGPNMSTDPPYDSWNSSHANESCANTAPRGGSGRLYCFRVTP